MATQNTFDFGDTEEANTKADAEKARKKARDFYTSDPEYAKKISEREEAKKQNEAMRQIVKEKAAKKAALAQVSMVSSGGNTTAAGRGETKGASGSAGSNEIVKNKLNYKKGGSVKKPTMKFETYTKTGKPAGMKTMTMASGGKASQLAKANGCAIRGKTKGRMV